MMADVEDTVWGTTGEGEGWTVEKVEGEAVEEVEGMLTAGATEGVGAAGAGGGVEVRSEGGSVGKGLGGGASSGLLLLPSSKVVGEDVGSFDFSSPPKAKSVSP